MKAYSKFIALFILATTLLVACDSSKVKELEEKNAQLEQQTRVQDSLLNDFMGTFNEFEENLATIKEKENLISMNTGDAEMRQDQKDRIVEDIQMINALLDQNRMMIEDLTAKAEKAEGSSAQYRSMVNTLKRQLAERDAQINSLKEQLAALNFEIESLNGRVNTLSVENTQLARLTDDQDSLLTSRSDTIESQAETIEAQQTEINTAYYVVGTKRELKDASILDGKVLNANLNDAAFKRIDIREIRQIPLSAKRAELVSAHPSDAYVLTDEDQDKVYDHLQITNPEKFWKTSRYLVVMTR